MKFKSDTNTKVFYPLLYEGFPFFATCAPHEKGEASKMHADDGVPVCNLGNLLSHQSRLC